MASGGTSTLRQVGSALGIAILGTMLAIGLGQGTRDRLQTAVDQLPPQATQAFPFPADELPELIAKPIESTFGQALPGILADPQLPSQARPVIRSAVEDSFVDGAVNASRAATGFVLLGVLISLFIPNTRNEGERDRS